MPIAMPKQTNKKIKNKKQKNFKNNEWHNILTKIPRNNLIAQLYFLKAFVSNCATITSPKNIYSRTSWESKPLRVSHFYIYKKNHLRPPICLKEWTSSDQNIKAIRVIRQISNMFHFRPPICIKEWNSSD